MESSEGQYRGRTDGYRTSKVSPVLRSRKDYGGLRMSWTKELLSERGDFDGIEADYRPVERTVGKDVTLFFTGVIVYAVIRSFL